MLHAEVDIGETSFPLPLSRRLLAGLWRALGLVCVLLGWECELGAQVRFDMFLGYDGAVPQAAWFPVTFEIQNDGPPFVATIDVGESGMQGGIRRSTSFELPTGTLKRVMLPLFSPEAYMREWDAVVRDASGKTVATARQTMRQRVFWNGRLVGSLAPSAAAAVAFPRMLQESRWTSMSAARLLPHLFPDNPLALEGLSVLHLDSSQALQLKATQVEALVRWVNSGGRLIVTVSQGADLAGVPWLRALLPGIPQSLGSARAGVALEQYLREGWRSMAARLPTEEARALVALAAVEADTAFTAADVPTWRLEPRAGSQTILKLDNQPLVLSIGRGWGKVMLLAFTPEREPLLSWMHAPWMWAMLCGAADPGSTERHNSGGTFTDSLFGFHVDSRQIRKIPVGWLLLLLLAYLAVIGPIDRWWLKKVRKEMLTWITFPCYVFFFSGLVYWLGFALRAGEVEWNEVQIVDMIPARDRVDARVRSHGSVYSPGNRRFDFVGREFSSAFRPEAETFGGWGRESGRVDQRGQGFSASIQVPIWTSKMFIHDAWSTNLPGLRLDISKTGAGLRIRAENQTPHEIRQTLLFMGDSVHTLAPFPPGLSDQTLENVAVRAATSLTDFLKTHAPAIGQGSRERRQAFDTFNSEGLRERIRLIDTLASASFPSRLHGEGEDSSKRWQVAAVKGMDLSRVLDTGGFVVLGIIEGNALLPEFAGFPRGRGHSDTLIRCVGFLPQDTLPVSNLP